MKTPGSPEEPQLIETSAALGDSSTYAYCVIPGEYTNFRNPFTYLAEGLAKGLHGFKKDPPEAEQVMHTYGLAGREEVRAMHIYVLHRAAAKGKEMVQECEANKLNVGSHFFDIDSQFFSNNHPAFGLYFDLGLLMKRQYSKAYHDQVLEYMEQGSDAAFESYFSEVSGGGVVFEKLEEGALLEKLHYYAHDKKIDLALSEYITKVCTIHMNQFPNDLLTVSELDKYLTDARVRKETFKMSEMLTEKELKGYEVLFREDPKKFRTLAMEIKMRELILKYAQHDKREIARSMHIGAFARNLYGFKRWNKEEWHSTIVEYVNEGSEVARWYYFKLLPPPRDSSIPLHTLVGKEVVHYAKQGSTVAQMIHIESVKDGKHGFIADPHEVDKLRLEYGIF